MSIYTEIADTESRKGGVRFPFHDAAKALAFAEAMRAVIKEHRVKALISTVVTDEVAT